MYNDVLIVSLFYMALKKYLFVSFFILLYTVSFCQQNKIVHYTVKDGLPSNKIKSITQDKIGYLWVATEKGVVKFDGNLFNSTSTKNTNSINYFDESIFINNDNSLSIIKQGIKNLEAKKIIKIFKFTDLVFLATEKGISVVKENYIQPLQIHIKIDFSLIYDIVFLNNVYYIASTNGLWKADSLVNTTTINKISNTGFISLETLQNKVIAATLNNGLRVFENDILINSFNTLKNISEIKKIKNDFWISSNTDGIEILSLPSFSFKQKINKYNTLQTNQINSIFKDSKDFIWIATNNGLYRYDQPAEKTHFPKIFFETLLINNKNVDSLLYKSKVLSFPYDKNNITINFKTVDLKNSKKVLYQYNFNGNISKWSKNNEIQLAGLEYGKHKLSIQSKLEDRVSKIKHLSFIIETPLYKKAWFILLGIVLILILATIIVHFYIKSIKKKSQEKILKLNQESHLVSLEQKALQLQMNPHFIFNVLNGIKALGNSNKIEEMNVSISLFSSMLRNILQNSLKEEINLKEEIDSITSYLELEKRMNSKDFKYEITLELNNIDSEEIIIPSMLLQPFIENSIKHGFNNGENFIVKIEITVLKNYIEFTIIDNGIGFKQSLKNKKITNHKSVAIQLTKERILNTSKYSNFIIEELNKDKNIIGTRVSFRLPLITDF